MLKYAAIAVVALVGATPALAQETSAFEGGRIEALAGWDHAKFAGTSDSGVVFGVGAGYDVDVGGVIFGIEGEFTDASTKKLGVVAKRDLYAGVRLGTEVGTGTLAYVKLGYSNARVGCGGSCSSDQNGIRAGLGIEHQFGRMFFVKAEYRYTNYDDGFSRHQAVAGLGVRF